ncbi:hypothetical protein OAG63_01415, partial [Methylacidiphilales bacterium]|nr:hypothetical protein [Candidatus Methylacidiphilales bacterium]
MTGLTRSLHVFLWSCVIVYIAISSLRINQVDIWWQLPEGLHLLHTWQLPTQAPAAFGLPPSPYFDDYAGYELILAIIYHIGGFVGIWVIFAFAFLGIFFLPLITSPKKHRDLGLLSTLLFLAAAILMLNRFEERPDTMGSLLLVILICLLRSRTLESLDWRHLLALFTIFLFWTNTHSSFIIGLFVLFLWLAQECLIGRPFNPKLIPSGKAGLVAGIALCACALNPYGVWRFCFPFLQQIDPGSTALSLEMQPVVLYSAPGIAIFLASLLLFFGLLSPKRPPLWLCCFALVALIMTIKSFRYVNFLAVALLF